LDIRESKVDHLKTLEVRFEDVMEDFYDTMQKVFNHCNFNLEELNFATQVSSKENVKKMSEKELKKNTHIVSKRTSKWKDYFNEDLETKFHDLYGDLLRRYNYEL
jgi:hypothetical protein